MAITWTNRIVTSLKTNEVFVFGTNATGFHGAGAAGLAFRGKADASGPLGWRYDPKMLTAMKAPVGDAARKGNWAVYGIARGPMLGYLGQSYGIQTIMKPGHRRSTTRREIYYQLLELIKYSKENLDKLFLITPIGEGYAGWTFEEMQIVWKFIEKQHGIPSNWEFIGRADTITYS